RFRKRISLRRVFISDYSIVSKRFDMKNLIEERSFNVLIKLFYNEIITFTNSLADTKPND
ncbi:hypothetical protein PABG_12646, partial [Paracoccidioides brasiliensis Pb03]